MPPRVVVVTVVLCTLPVKPPEATPLIVVVPAVVHAVTTPTSSPTVTLAPVRMIAVLVVTVATAVFDDVSVIVMSLGAVVGLLEASRSTAVIVVF